MLDGWTVRVDFEVAELEAQPGEPPGGRRPKVSPRVGGGLRPFLPRACRTSSGRCIIRLTEGATLPPPGAYALRLIGISRESRRGSRRNSLCCVGSKRGSPCARFPKPPSFELRPERYRQRHNPRSFCGPFRSEGKANNPDAWYAYTIVAFDEAGNRSDLSQKVRGGCKIVSTNPATHLAANAHGLVGPHIKLTLSRDNRAPRKHESGTR